jgi:hypothetical protein
MLATEDSKIKILQDGMPMPIHPIDPKNKNDLTCISKWKLYLILIR